jgi:hypothetical protein
MTGLLLFWSANMTYPQRLSINLSLRMHTHRLTRALGALFAALARTLIHTKAERKCIASDYVFVAATALVHSSARSADANWRSTDDVTHIL